MLKKEMENEIISKEMIWKKNKEKKWRRIYSPIEVGDPFTLNCPIYVPFALKCRMSWLCEEKETKEKSNDLNDRKKERNGSKECSLVQLSDPQIPLKRHE